MPKTIRAVAIALNKNKILLIHRKSNGKEYYTFPGGGVEKNETVEQAVLRELFEETTLKADINKLLYIHKYDDNSEQYFYLLKNCNGLPKLDKNSIEYKVNSKINFYRPEWIKINSLSNLLLYPLELRDLLIEDITIDFKDCPKEQIIKVSERREY